MKRKHVETSREIRLWIGQVFIPAFTCLVITLTNEQALSKMNRMKDKVVSKFRKK